MKMKFKKPKNGHFYYYCYECFYWHYTRTIGAANIGECSAVEPEEKDAYDPPCGLFRRADNG